LAERFFKKRKIVVSNASPLIFSAKIGILDLLQKLYGKLYVPPMVDRETRETGRKERAPDAIIVDKAVESGWITVKELSGWAKKEVGALLRTPGLHKGECEAIALARQIGADLLLIDERVGSGAAKAWGLEVIGILGAIIEAMAKGFVTFDEVKAYFDRLIDVEFGLSSKDYKRALEMAEKVRDELEKRKNRVT